MRVKCMADGEQADVNHLQMLENDTVAFLSLRRRSRRCSAMGVGYKSCRYKQFVLRSRVHQRRPGQMWGRMFCHLRCASRSRWKMAH